MPDRKQPGCGPRDDVLEDQVDLDEGDAPSGVLDGSLVPDVGPVLDLSLLQQKRVIIHNTCLQMEIKLSIKPYALTKQTI